MRYLTYTTENLQRHAELRNDGAWIERMLADPLVLIWPIWNNLPLVSSCQTHIVSISPQIARGFIQQGSTYMVAGTLAGAPVLAIDISAVQFDPENPAEQVGTDGQFLELRPFTKNLDGDVSAIIAYARSLFVWHKSYRFCGSCGHATWPQEHGHSRKCENVDCNTQHFPRINPAVIMLVTAADQALLGRSPQFPPGLHSVLAGFVEHGENLEQAVAREVKEEVGLNVDRVTYVDSQPWPYSNSLMFGFHAEIDADTPPELTIDPVEIETARWWTREELIAKKEEPDFFIPPRDAIARRLLDIWLDG
ncbi:MAG: NAD(+) diphosphatase [Alphaproteobacteria bacterium]